MEQRDDNQDTDLSGYESDSSTGKFPDEEQKEIQFRNFNNRLAANSFLRRTSAVPRLEMAPHESENLYPNKSHERSTEYASQSQHSPAYRAPLQFSPGYASQPQSSPRYAAAHLELSRLPVPGLGLTPGLFPSEPTAGYLPMLPGFLPLSPAISDNAIISRALASGAPRRERGEKKPIPTDLKDNKYFERRKRNNLAAKKSRDCRKAREGGIAMRADYLEKENAVLRAQVMTLREEASSLQHLLAQKRPKKEPGY